MKPKLLYITSSRFPSREANTHNSLHMVNAYAQMGLDVGMVCMTAPGVRAVDLEREYAMSFEATLLPVPFPAVAMRGRMIYFRAMCRYYARRWAPDLVTGRDLRSIAMLDAAGYTSVFENHGPAYERKPASHRPLFEQLVASPHCKRIVLNSEGLLRWYAEDGIDVSTFVVLHNGSVDHGYSPRTHAANGPLRVGYAGSLYPGKGMEIIGELARRMPDAEFHCYGGSASEIAAWKEAFSEADNLTMHGHVPSGDLPALCHALDVLVAPYQRIVRTSGADPNAASYMSPVKLFEYMATGAPIVASDLPAIRAILADGDTALLADPDDIDAWVAALRRVQREPDLVARLSTRQLAQFRARHTWEGRAEAALAGLV